MNPLYELVPISEPPIKDGYYTVIDPEDSSQDEAFYFLEGDWFQSEHDARVNENHFTLDVQGCLWLREIPAETLKARIREELDKCWNASKDRTDWAQGDWFPETPTDRETYINSVIDNLFKQ